MTIMKKCSQCRELKKLTEFSPRSNKKGHRGQCKSCRNTQEKERYQKDSNKIKARIKKYTEENREKILDRKKRYYQENKERINIEQRGYINRKRHGLKQKCVDYMGGECFECGGVFEPCQFCFHHLNPNEKEFNISDGILQNRSWEGIVEELDKCVMLCLHCHVLTYCREDIK